MAATPSMKDVADQNHYAFSPHPYSVALFFLAQMVVQIYWLTRFFVFSAPPTYGHRVTLPAEDNLTDPDARERRKGASMRADALVPPEATTEPEPAMMAYAPIFAVGNLSIALWAAFWMRYAFGWAQLCVTVNTFAQLYAAFYLLKPGTPYELGRGNGSTHVVAKMTAAIGVMDFFDNGAVFLRIAPPSRASPLLVLPFVLFLALGVAADPILGAGLLYIAIGLLVGQAGAPPVWRNALGAGTLAAGATLAGKLVWNMWRRKGNGAAQ